jgi:pre-mRNA-splicing factor SYF1
MISKNPNKIFTINVESVIRQGIQRYSDQVGVLWLALAEYYLRKPNFERVSHL